MIPKSETNEVIPTITWLFDYKQCLHYKCREGETKQSSGVQDMKISPGAR